MEFSLEYKKSNFKKFKKGQFGNFKDYYQRKYDKWEDQRLSLIDKEYIDGKRVLYIGCHEGVVPITLALKFKPANIEAIDIDPFLIVKAIKNCQMVDSIKKYIKNDKKQSLHVPMNNKYFKLIELISESNQKTTASILDTITFRLKNIVEPETEENFKKFDTIICFSLTKYIHFNYGDNGIRALINNCQQLLEDNGILIIEPNRSSSYRKLKFFSKVFSESFKNMNLLPENFSKLITNSGARLLEKIKYENPLKKKIGKTSNKKEILVFKNGKKYH